MKEVDGRFQHFYKLLGYGDVLDAEALEKGFQALVPNALVPHIPEHPVVLMRCVTRSCAIQEVTIDFRHALEDDTLSRCLCPLCGFQLSFIHFLRTQILTRAAQEVQNMIQEGRPGSQG